MTEKNKKSPENPIDVFLNVPLFEVFQFSKDDESLYQLEYFHGTMDCYCLYCKKDSVFSTRKKEYQSSPYEYTNYYFHQFFTCSRDKNHQLFFIFRVHGNEVSKVGQYPSLADLSTSEIQKYRKPLDEQSYREFSRAIGLASHGVGIGSYVYLRRIFESLIEKYYIEALHEGILNEENYSRARMDEKINLLKNKLPSFLVENNKLYSILSKGIHSLSEDECLQYFPVLKLGIELILDEEIERLRKEEKVKKATKDLSSIHQELKEDKA